jgi:ribosomal protein S18 acetylase RimI-like enzyme
MILLKSILSENFSEYREIFIRDYSDDLTINHGYSDQESLNLAEKSFASSFPNNTAIPSDELLCIVAADNIVGYLWYSIDKNDAKAFICDFYMYDHHRGKGYGKTAIALLETMLLQLNVNYLGLRVAYNNPRALELYKNIGFNISGINMSKRINAPRTKT